MFAGVSNEFLELKITLRGIKPRIWRRIQVPKEFRIKGDSATYTYDFGDDWIHNVVLEKTVVLDSPFENYPKILAGRRVCPPEGKKTEYHTNVI